VEAARPGPQGTVFEGNRIVGARRGGAVRVESAGEGTFWKGNAIEGRPEGLEEVEGIRAGASTTVE
jgi:hypothetical protein